MPRHAAQQGALQDQCQGTVGEIIQFPPAPDAGSDTPGPDLGPITAARLEHWCGAYDIPPSTVRALRAQGKGPPTFEIGRLVFCLRKDWCEWLENLATLGGSGRLSPPAGRLRHRTGREIDLVNMPVNKRNAARGI
jgi:hypothetical protein